MSYPARTTAVTWLGLALLIALICQPLLGAPPKGHDLSLHFYRIPAVNALWERGIFYSRWLPDLVLGYGSPLFNFYPPLSAYLLTGAYWLTGANAPVGYNLAYALALALSAASMFALGQFLFGRTGGLFAAAAYALAPHLLYQTYARGSLSNALAMALFPLATLALIRVAERVPIPRRVALAALPFAGTLLSHTAASLLFAGPLLVMGATAAVTPATHAPTGRRLAGVGLALLLGLALSAFAWLPAVAEFSFTRYTTSAEGVEAAAHFADIWQWPQRPVAELNNAPWPKTPGIGQLILGGVGILLAFWSVGRAIRQGQRPLPQADLLVAVSGVMALGTLFLATSPSAWLWEQATPLANFQFPWRLLDVPTFFLALACGRISGQWSVFSFQFSVFGGRWSVVRGWMVVVGLLLFFANALPYLYPPRWEGLPQRPTLADVTHVQQYYGIYGLTAWGEYTTSAVREWPAAPPFPGADLGATLAEKLQVADLPSGAVVSAAGDSLRADLQVDLAVPTTLTFAHHYFPGWTAVIDGQTAPLQPDVEGRLSVAVPAGRHTVSLYFGRTPVRWLADGLSWLAVLLIGIGLVWQGKPAAVSPRREASSRVTAVPAGVLALLLLSKLFWFDHFNSPLLIHAADGTIPGVTPAVWGDFDGRLRLAGYQVTEPDQLTLYWQAQRPLTAIYPVAVTLADARGVPVKTLINPTPGDNVTTTWQVGQLTRDVYTLPVDQGIRPIGYRLHVAVLDPVTNQPLPLLDSPGGTAVESPVGTLKLGPLPVEETAVSVDAQTVGAIFGEAIELHQVSVPTTLQAGEPLDVTFVWRSLAPAAVDYTVFVHLLDGDGHLIANNDSQPLAGIYPTSFWSPGETVVDQRSWQPAVPPGEYRLEVGLYRLDTGERLPVSGGNAGLGDRVLVAVVAVR